MNRRNEPATKPREGGQRLLILERGLSAFLGLIDARACLLMIVPMPPTTVIAWLFILAGLLLAAVGVIWLLVPAAPFLGHLPGDIHIDRGHVHFYFPLTTCIVLSVGLTLIFWLVRLFFQ
jgi:hypothetical protein